MEVELNVDSKGRISLPPEFREELGDTVVATKTPEGLLLKPGRKADFFEEFKRAITSEPKRTGKPENWPPKKMKAIWGT